MRLNDEAILTEHNVDTSFMIYKPVARVVCIPISRLKSIFEDVRRDDAYELVVNIDRRGGWRC